MKKEEHRVIIQREDSNYFQVFINLDFMEINVNMTCKNFRDLKQVHLGLPSQTTVHIQ